MATDDPTSSIKIPLEKILQDIASKISDAGPGKEDKKIITQLRTAVTDKIVQSLQRVEVELSKKPININSVVDLVMPVKKDSVFDQYDVSNQLKIIEIRSKVYDALIKKSTELATSISEAVVQTSGQYKFEHIANLLLGIGSRGGVSLLDYDVKNQFKIIDIRSSIYDALKSSSAQISKNILDSASQQNITKNIDILKYILPIATAKRWDSPALETLQESLYKELYSKTSNIAKILLENLSNITPSEILNSLLPFKGSRDLAKAFSSISSQVLDIYKSYINKLSVSVEEGTSKIDKDTIQQSIVQHFIIPLSNTQDLENSIKEIDNSLIQRLRAYAESIDLDRYIQSPSTGGSDLRGIASTEVKKAKEAGYSIEEKDVRIATFNTKEKLKIGSESINIIPPINYYAAGTDTSTTAINFNVKDRGIKTEIVNISDTVMQNFTGYLGDYILSRNKAQNEVVMFSISRISKDLVSSIKAIKDEFIEKFEDIASTTMSKNDNDGPSVPAIGWWNRGKATPIPAPISPSLKAGKTIDVAAEVISGTKGAVTAGEVANRSLLRSIAPAAGAIGRGIAKIATPLTVGYEAYQGYKEYKEADKLEDKEQQRIEKSKAVGGAVGAVGGTLGGAALGAKIGGAAGALFGGVGAVPGALIGGLLGSVVGSIGGRAAGKSTAEMIVRDDDQDRITPSSERSAPVKQSDSNVSVISDKASSTLDVSSDVHDYTYDKQQVTVLDRIAYTLEVIAKNNNLSIANSYPTEYSAPSSVERIDDSYDMSGDIKSGERFTDSRTIFDSRSRYEDMHNMRNSLIT